CLQWQAGVARRARLRRAGPAGLRPAGAHSTGGRVFNRRTHFRRAEAARGCALSLRGGPARSACRRVTAATRRASCLAPAPDVGPTLPADRALRLDRQTHDDPVRGSANFLPACPPPAPTLSSAPDDDRGAGG